MMIRAEAPSPDTLRALSAVALLRRYSSESPPTPCWGGADGNIAASTANVSRVRLTFGRDIHVYRIHRPLPVSAVVADDALFQLLIKNWHEERGATSSITQIIACTSYQRIIGMGERALPLIFDRLQAEGDDPDHWGWALHVITGVNPVSPEAAGDTVQIAQAWLDWWRAR